ncbi:hypothetical protein [Streptomyces sp. NPDC088794]|uniref:hypothetical protein n=1 Tax=Streptomyces sp. NPDC088794 TaxID=3365902 RepID=UPI0038017DDF
MRGKHGTAAQNRRERAELEQRATKAEQRVERLEKELATLRESSQRQISGLRGELGQVAKERDEATSPELAKAQEQIAKLARERNDANEYVDKMKIRWGLAFQQLKESLVAVGLTETEVMEIFAGAMDGSPKTVTAGIQGSYDQSDADRDRIRAIQRARGIRGPRERLVQAEADTA